MVFGEGACVGQDCGGRYGGGGGVCELSLKGFCWKGRGGDLSGGCGLA